VKIAINMGLAITCWINAVTYGGKRRIIRLLSILRRRRFHCQGDCPMNIEINEKKIGTALHKL